MLVTFGCADLTRLDASLKLAAQHIDILCGPANRDLSGGGTNG